MCPSLSLKSISISPISFLSLLACIPFHLSHFFQWFVQCILLLLPHASQETTIIRLLLHRAVLLLLFPPKTGKNWVRREGISLRDSKGNVIKNICLRRLLPLSPTKGSNRIAMNDREGKNKKIEWEARSPEEKTQEDEEKGIKERKKLLLSWGWRMMRGVHEKDREKHFDRFLRRPYFSFFSFLFFVSIFILVFHFLSLELMKLRREKEDETTKTWYLH